MSTPKHETEKFILRPGQVVNGRFEVVSHLGSGGFATVYVARQTNIGRKVALKLLNVTFNARRHNEMRERFEREARIAAQIDHPNVVTIHDYGIYEATGQPFIVMELLRGHDLEHELIQGGPLPPERALPLFRETLDALAAGHRRDVVHKDLKPSNLFLNHPGDRLERVIVLDFGIAGVQADKARLTATGQVLGTPQYLAPEYIHQQLVTPTIDVYQMGLILVEMLTGQPMVNFENPMKCMMVHGNGQLEIPAQVQDGRLGEIVRKALAFDHTARYPDADAFAEAIQDLNSGLFGPMTSGQISVPRQVAHTDDLARPTTGELELVAGERIPTPVAAASAPLRAAGTPTPTQAAFAETAAVDVPEDLRSVGAHPTLASPAPSTSRVNAPTTTVVPARGRRAWWVAALLLLLGLGAVAVVLADFGSGGETDSAARAKDRAAASVAPEAAVVPGLVPAQDPVADPKAASLADAPVDPAELPREGAAAEAGAAVDAPAPDPEGDVVPSDPSAQGEEPVDDDSGAGDEAKGAAAAEMVPGSAAADTPTKGRKRKTGRTRPEPAKTKPFKAGGW